MESAFVVQFTGFTRTSSHLADQITVAQEPDGDAYDVLTDGGGAERVVDVRGVWLVVEIDTSAPAGLSGSAGGQGTSLRRLALDLLTALSVKYRPDAAVPSVEIDVVPDLGHGPTLYAAKRGMLVPGTVLRLRSRLRYAPDDALLVALAASSLYA